MLGRVVGGNTIPPNHPPLPPSKGRTRGPARVTPPDWMQRHFSNS